MASNVIHILPAGEQSREENSAEEWMKGSGARGAGENWELS